MKGDTFNNIMAFIGIALILYFVYLAWQRRAEKKINGKIIRNF